jgi:glycopeptide antibiotics resistance protein
MLEGRWLYLALIPISLAVVAIVVPWAGWGRALVALIALGHVVVLTNVALFPIPIDPVAVVAARVAGSASSANGGLNLVPFATIGRVVGGDAPPIERQIAVLNVFVLTPAGMYLPVLFRSLRDWRALAPFTIAGGASIEAAQLATSSALGFRYRTIDVDDVLLNAIGIAVGWLAVHLVVRARDGATVR